MAEHKSQFRLHSMCRVLRVQHSGYYAWQVKPKSKRTLADEFLLVKIKQSFEESQSIYGSSRVHCDSREDGVLCREKRIARLKPKAQNPKPKAQSPKPSNSTVWRPTSDEKRGQVWMDINRLGNSVAAYGL